MAFEREPPRRAGAERGDDGQPDGDRIDLGSSRSGRPAAGDAHVTVPGAAREG